MRDELDDTRALSRAAASERSARTGWRYLLGALCAQVGVDSFQHGTELVAAAVDAAGSAASGHLRADLRADRVLLTLQTAALGAVTERDVQLAQAITARLTDRGSPPSPGPLADGGRSVQMLEIGIDALDIASIRPFWRAVLGYGDEPGRGGPEDGVCDLAEQGPTVWFQQMEVPRPQRNRIHVDITVPHDEAPGRVAAALAAGGRLVSEEHARSFWVLADAEGNEVCVCTWQDRD
jgi:4a-hydroxytetrahydrobiopterin dehydratase